MGVLMNTLLKLMAFLLSRDILPDRFLSWHKKISNNRNIFVTKILPFSGVKIKLNIGDHVQYCIYIKKGYEYEYLEYFSNIIDRRGVFVDVGANVGSYSLSLCKKVKKVFAVEASKANCQHIIDTLKTNKINNVEVIHKAAYEVDGRKMKLYLSKDSAGNNSLFKSEENGGYEEVETITIDSLLGKFGNEKLFIKIDVEGGEGSVIDGAKNTILKRRPVIQCELNPFVSGANCEEIYSNVHRKIIDYGYHSYFIRGDKMQPFDYEKYFSNARQHINVLYLPKDALRYLRNEREL